MSEMKRVSDVAGGSLEGEYVPMAELLDKELVISKVVDMETQFGPALGVEFHDAEGFLEGFFITSHVAQGCPRGRRAADPGKDHQTRPLLRHRLRARSVLCR